MASGYRLKWNGREIARDVKAAAVRATEQTTEAAAARARSDHGWRSRTGTAERSIQSQPPAVVGDRIEGQFGSYGPEAYYFIFLEVGTSKMPADDTLRRAGDAEFANHASRVAEAFR